MATWRDDGELFALMRGKLFPAVVGDILDTMGFLHQFLAPQIRPLKPDMVVIGRAMPVLEANCFAAIEPEGKSELSRKPFGLLFEALDDLRRNEVYVATGCAPQFALWGGLMTTRATHLKAAGAVLDGYSRGKVVDWRVGIEMNGVRVAPGDIVFGDLDGVLVIPRAAEEEAIRRALEKASTENRVRDAIRGGMSTLEAFKTFGVM
jgi:4-hydroxy-4-methyl-2-oxoglutarate aldolase